MTMTIMQTKPIEQHLSAKYIAIVGSDGMFCEMLGRYIEENEPCIVARLRDVPEIADQSELSDLDLLLIHEPSIKSIPWHILGAIARRKVRTIIITENNIWSIISSYYRKGAHGVILNSMPLSKMMNVIRFVMSGEVYAPVEIGLRKRDPEISDKRAREETIAKLVVLGKTNKEICEIMTIPMSTVKMDIRLACKKLSARNRTELAVKLVKVSENLGELE